MEEKFQSILDNYINGNRSDAKEAFEKLSGNELHNFSTWIKVYYSASHANNDVVFDFLVFLAC